MHTHTPTRASNHHTTTHLSCALHKPVNIHCPSLSSLLLSFTPLSIKQPLDHRATLVPRLLHRHVASLLAGRSRGATPFVVLLRTGPTAGGVALLRGGRGLRCSGGGGLRCSGGGGGCWSQDMGAGCERKLAVTQCGTVERPGLLKMCVVPKVEKSFQKINQAFCLKMFCC